MADIATRVEAGTMEVIHQERTLTMVAIRVTAEGEQRVAKLTKAKLCLSCESRKPYVRGLCNPCYQAMRRGVDAGKATENSLIKIGRLLPSASRGRPLSNPMSKQLAEK